VRFGRRPLFFLVVALICLLLIPANDPEFRWVNLFAAALAGFWSVLLWFEVLAGRGRGERGAGL
jgi:hypothetical protein